MIWFIQFLIISLFIRSNVYIGNTAISLLNVLNFIAIIYIAFAFKLKISKNFSTILLIILFFIFIELLYIFCFYNNINQFKELYYSSFIFTLFILIYWGVKNYQIKFIKITFNTIYYIYWVMLFIVIFEIITKQHLPASKGSVDKGFADYPTAFFYNPNDFATVIGLFFPFIYYVSIIIKKKIQIKIIAILSLFFIITSLSRMALLMLLLMPLFIFFINKKFNKLFFVFLVGTCFLAFLISANFKFFKNENNLIYRDANKLLTIIKPPKSVNQNNAASLINNIRFSVYKEIIVSPEKYIIGGGFLASGKLYEKHIIPLENPHSYWIEGIIDFGYIGFLPIIFLILFPLLLSIRNFNKDTLYKYFLIQIIYFIVLLNVPSSVMSLPIIWLPIAFFYALLFNIHLYKENPNLTNAINKNKI